ncbi:hypothetical protein [Jonesia quinghaiensis]|uniref:hypothetical protein n=1 Tax=Jonesia quinghaiensis TaxID=262806 RepID=UPI000412B9DA|nr:hypothetical protein [Jonesia quinghaiensis]
MNMLHRQPTATVSGHYQHTAMSLIIAVVAALIIMMNPAVQHAHANESTADFIAVTKTVDQETVGPGQPFTYELTVTCGDLDCRNVWLVDEFPTELEGFAITNIDVPTQGVPYDIQWFEDGDPRETTPERIGTATTLQVAFPTSSETEEPGDGSTSDPGDGSTTPPGDDDEPLLLRSTMFTDSGSSELTSGFSFTIAVTLEVPVSSDMYSDQFTVVTNTAHASASSNSDTYEAHDSATITIGNTTDLAVTLDGNWSRNTQLFEPGLQSTITITAQNTSPRPVDYIGISLPEIDLAKGAPRPTAGLFDTMNFVDFGPATMPDGCMTYNRLVSVDPTAHDPWEGGQTTHPTTLPEGINPQDVVALHIECIGVIEPGDTMTLTYTVEQRATTRDGTPITATDRNIELTATAAVATDNTREVRFARLARTTTVTYPEPQITLTGKLAPLTVEPGNNITVPLDITNGEAPARAMTITVNDPEFFSTGLTLAGFNDPITFPTGTTNAALTYHYRDGSEQDVTIDNEHTTPTPPHTPQDTTGFTLTFTGNTIPTGATATLAPRISTEAVRTTETQTRTTNITATSTTPAEQTANTTRTLELVIAPTHTPPPTPATPDTTTPDPIETASGNNDSETTSNTPREKTTQPTTTGTTPPSAATTPLANTGTTPAALIPLALAFTLTSIGLILTTRRRHTPHHQR